MNTLMDQIIETATSNAIPDTMPTEAYKTFIDGNVLYVLESGPDSNALSILPLDPNEEDLPTRPEESHIATCIYWYAGVTQDNEVAIIRASVLENRLTPKEFRANIPHASEEDYEVYCMGLSMGNIYNREKLIVLAMSLNGAEHPEDIALKDLLSKSLDLLPSLT